MFQRAMDKILQGIEGVICYIDAIVQAPEPENEQQLRLFLGLLNFYSKFIPNLATILHPLNQLLRKEVRWQWTWECADAFQQLS